MHVKGTMELDGSARTFFRSSGRAKTLRLFLSMQLPISNRVGRMSHDPGCRERTLAHQPGVN